MSMLAASKFRLPGQVKKSQVLSTINKRNFVSRKDISKITGLSAPVVTRLTKELIGEGFIEEVSKDEAPSNGRKPILLGLKKSSTSLIAIDIGGYATKGVLTNVNSEVMYKALSLTPRSSSKERMITFLIDMIQNLLKQGRMTEKNLYGIILVCGGLVDATAGKVVYNCNIPAMHDINLADALGKAFNVPIHLNTSTATHGIDEYEKSKSIGEDLDFIIVQCSYGLVLEPLIDGKIPVVVQPKGKVDFAHVTYDCNGPKCNCGSMGCVESYSSGWAIERDAKKNPSKLLLELVDGKVDDITTKTVFESAMRGDSECIYLLRNAGKILGQALAPFVQYYTPKRVIFCGNLVKSCSIYLDAVVEEMRRHIPRDRFDKFMIQITSLDEYAGAVGATRLLAHDLLNSPLEELVRLSL